MSRPEDTWAARLGEWLEEGRSLDGLDVSDFEVDEESDRAVLQRVLAYRKKHAAAREELREELSGARSEQIWSSIEREIRPEANVKDERDRRPGDRPARERVADREAQQSTRRSSRRLLGWAAAAVALVVAGVLTWTLTQTGPAVQTELVAESGAQIETVETGDGAVVRLRPHSTLERVDVDGADRYRLDGEALFEVASGREVPFEVVAGDAVVQVLGTRFTVRTWTQQPEVFLSEGRVLLRNEPTASADTLRPGQRGTVGPAGTVSVATADSTAYVDWLRGRITFEQRRLGRILREVEQAYGVRLTVPDAMRDETFTGTLRLSDDPDRTLQDLGTVMGGRFEATGPRTYRFIPSGD